LWSIDRTKALGQLGIPRSVLGIPRIVWRGRRIDHRRGRCVVPRLLRGDDASDDCRGAETQDGSRCRVTVVVMVSAPVTAAMPVPAALIAPVGIGRRGSEQADRNRGSDE